MGKAFECSPGDLDDPVSDLGLARVAHDLPIVARSQPPRYLGAVDAINAQPRSERVDRLEARYGPGMAAARGVGRTSSPSLSKPATEAPTPELTSALSVVKEFSNSLAERRRS